MGDMAGGSAHELEATGQQKAIAKRQTRESH
jgi:hypothetical protein